MSWIDTTCQQIFANGVLVQMAEVLGRQDEVSGLRDEIDQLRRLINDHMWNDDEAFYVDRFRDGSLSSVKSVGAYWALLADITPSDRMGIFIDHLSNEREFKRPHRIPSLSADHPDYCSDGGYWRGGVWSPTNYMVLRGLTHVGKNALAHEIALNHLENVVSSYVSQGTLFENYAPERAEGLCTKDFVGWTGISPISILFEYVFGIRPDAGNRRLVWDVRLLESHGVNAYPIGVNGVVDLSCATRKSFSEPPVISAQSNIDIELIVKWSGGERVMALSASA
jgi:glycogen debranching enzyme